MLEQPIEWSQVVNVTTHTHSSRAENAGVRLGRAWWTLRRREKQFAALLAEKGVPAGATAAVFWIIKLILIVAILYFSLVIAVFVAALLIAAHVISQADPSHHEKNKPQWRDGLLGFGLYTHDGFRIDPHDPDEMR